MYKLMIKLFRKQNGGIGTWFLGMAGALIVAIIMTIAVPIMMDTTTRMALSEAISVLKENGYVAYAAPAGDWTTLGDLYTQDIYPQTDSTYNIGSVGGEYANGYFDKITASNITTGAITDSGLTAGRVPYAGVGGLLTDDSGLTYDSSTNTLKVGNIITSAGVIGVQWNKVTDTWINIDANGNTITLTSTDFDNSPIWGGMRRCTVTDAGEVTYGTNARGDGLTLNGTTGRVMVEVPKFWVKSESPSANVYNWWISATDLAGFSIHPAFVQRGGVEKDHIYVGAYNADFQYDGDNEVYDAGHEKLHSRTGKQPYTGANDCIFSIPIDDLGTEPAIGDLVSTPTDGSFYIVDYVKTAGNWAGGTAGDTATIWLRKPGQATCGMANGEVLTNDTTTTTIGNTTAADTPRNVTIGHSRTLAGNIGAGWGLLNVWSLSAVQLLFYTEYAGADSQSLVGKGIVDKAAGTGFAGENSGALSADTNIGVNGTGTGTGTNGLTPIVYRGIENLWGNIWQFIDGWNAVDAEYRLVNRDGTGTLADTLAGGSYEASIGIPITIDGFIANILYEDLTKYAFIASAIIGSSGTYLYDYWYGHDTGETSILLAGGYWNAGAYVGVGRRSVSDVAAKASQTIGSRLEFIRQY